MKSEKDFIEEFYKEKKNKKQKVKIRRLQQIKKRNKALLNKYKKR